jgi:hypothetical protein
MGRLKVAAAGVAAAGVLAAAAGGATAAVFLHVAPSPVHRGHRVIIRGNVGSGCPTGDAVTIISKAFAHTHDFAGLPAVFALVRSGGKFGVRPRIPSTKAPGGYSVTARCGGGNLGVSATIHVVA